MVASCICSIKQKFWERADCLILQKSQRKSRQNQLPPCALRVGHLKLQVQQVKQVSFKDQRKLGYKFTSTLRSDQLTIATAADDGATRGCHRNSPQKPPRRRQAVIFSCLYPTYTWVIADSVAAILAPETFAIKALEETILNVSTSQLGMRVSHHVPTVKPETHYGLIKG